MWTRAELKARAKMNVRKYYWAAFAVCLICGLFGGGGNSGSASAGANAGVNASQEYNLHITEDMSLSLPSIIGAVPEAISEITGAIDPVSASIMLVAALIGLAVAIAISVFVAPIVEVGKNRFFMESRAAGYSAGMDELLWGFKHNYLNIVWVMFLRGLLVFLGTICCVVPGIYLGYCYYMVPYILAENPEMKARDAFKLSTDMMQGHKLNTWVLEISFFGWWILGTLMCGIGTMFIQPYYEATLAELYAVLRSPFAFGLNGFGIPDMGPAGSGYYDGGYGNQGGYYGGPNGNGGYYQADNAGWNDSSYTQNDSYQNAPFYGANTGYDSGNGMTNGAAQPPAERGGEVKRSEGGPGRGYYLNGVFHPYTDDELDELNRNQK